MKIRVHRTHGPDLMASTSGSWAVHCDGVTVGSIDGSLAPKEDWKGQAMGDAAMVVDGYHAVPEDSDTAERFFPVADHGTAAAAMKAAKAWLVSLV